MFHGRVSSWNLRDNHMVETLQALDKHLGAAGGPPKMIVWAHNSHLGDASATEMGDIGEWNVGQLARDRWGSEAMLVGFSTHRGTVTAASEWDGGRAAQARAPGAGGKLRRPVPSRRRGAQRAIGVIYQPQTERMSHYFHTRLPAQFDAMIHIDETRAVEPLVPEPAWHAGEPSETYPTGL